VLASDRLEVNRDELISVVSHVIDDILDVDSRRFNPSNTWAVSVTILDRN
jgi:hypothetical protein